MGTPVRFTTADLETLPDTLDDTRYEVIDGKLYMAHQPHWDHQFACFQIAAALQAWSRQTGAGVANVAPDVIFSPEDDVAPDVMAQTIQIYRRHEAQLRLVATLTNEDSVTSPLLPGFACPVADLWEPQV